MSFNATTSQTVGPYFSIGLTRLRKADLVGSGVSGEKIAISGRVTDGEGKPVPDAMLEIWQANSHGKYAHPEDTQDKPLEPTFQGYGRMGVDENGRFAFTTVKPGAVPGPGRKNAGAPHCRVCFRARIVVTAGNADLFSRGSCKCERLHPESRGARTARYIDCEKNRCRGRA